MEPNDAKRQSYLFKGFIFIRWRNSSKKQNLAEERKSVGKRRNIKRGLFRKGSQAVKDTDDECYWDRRVNKISKGRLDTSLQLIGSA